MANRALTRIYFRRKNDYVYLASIKVSAKTGDIYISYPMGEDEFGVRNQKFSYHSDGQTHLTATIPELKQVEDKDKWAMTGGKLGHSGEKVYAMSKQLQPLNAINGLVYLDFSISIRDIHTIGEGMSKCVKPENIKLGAEIIDGKDYKHLVLRFFVAPSSMAVRIKLDPLCVFRFFKHPSLGIVLGMIATDELHPNLA